MKYVKSFNEILKESYGESGQITYDQIKETSGYKDMISSGFVDITTPTMQKNGNIRFSHPASPLEYSIFSNGYIRYQNSGTNWMGGRSSQAVYASPIGDKKSDQMYGRPIKNIQDFDIKFRYVKSVLVKTILKSLGIPPKSVEETDVLSDIINRHIEKDAGLIKSPAVKSLIDLGIFKPSGYSELMASSADFGLI